MMRRYCGFMPALVCAILALAGCGGGGGVGSPLGPAAQSQPHFLKLYRTPALPPKRRHAVTGADRARARAGGWQPVSAHAPFSGGADTEMLMTDGSVMVHDACTSNWFDLVPDKTGSYVSGTWTQKASMPSNYTPLYFASAVLPDGKLIVDGGEYNAGCLGDETSLGAIYDPVANSWKAVLPPNGWSEIGDAQSVVLANGIFMLGNCCASVQALLNESTMTWTQSGPGNGKHDGNSEEGWTLLKDGSVLVADVDGAPASERYAPGNNEWASAGTIPVNLTSGDEIGPQTLRPNGTVFVAGANGATAVYHFGNKSWSVGPNFPIVGGQQLDVADGPATVLVDGTVMLPASPGLYQAPAYFYIFNGERLAAIPGPPNAPNDSSYNVRLLMLPNAQVLETDGSGDVEVYTSPRQPLTRTAPAIVSVPSTLTHGNTYAISGKRFNGSTQANMYGDDAQQATNFPIVRIVNNATGHVFYARTHDHSFMGVASDKTVSTKFDVPAGIESGASMLYVIANGVASSPVSVTID